MPDGVIEGEWGALYSLGDAGYRHFLPAYLRFSLRHPNSGFASVQATILSLTPSFSQKTFVGFDAAQRAAVIAFLETMDALGYDDIGNIGEALAYWRRAGGEK